MEKNTINVLHISSEKVWRGGEQQIAYLLEELNKYGIKNYIIVRKGSDFERYCIEKKYTYFSIPLAGSINLSTSLKIKSICKKYAIHIVHLNSAKSHSLAVISAVFGNKTPLVLSRRVDFAPKNNWFTRWKYNHSSIKKIICVSDKIKHTIRAYIDSPGKAVTVHSGIDVDKFNSEKIDVLRKEFNIDNSTFLIGNISALDHSKDYYTFIDTIKILHDKKLPIKSFIIGKGPLEAELKKYALQSGLKDTIIFTGFRNDITDILPNLNIFLITSKEEGLGTSVLDAFAARVPVVATAAGGIPEMVIHNKTGLLAPIGDSDTLAGNIEQLIQQPELKENLIRGALHKLHEFSKERTAQKTLEVYKDVLTTTPLHYKPS